MIPAWIDELPVVKQIFKKSSDREAELLGTVPEGLEAHVLESTDKPDYIGNGNFDGKYLALIVKCGDKKAQGWLFENNESAGGKIAKFLTKASHT